MFSAAKIMAIIYAIIGLIYGVIFMIFMMFVGLAAISYPNSYSPAGAGGAFLGGIFILILTPIFAAIGGFIAGALFAFIYNLAVGWIRAARDGDGHPRRRKCPGRTGTPAHLRIHPDRTL